MPDETERSTTTAAPPEVRDADEGPERHGVPDASAQLGNAASTSPGGGEMTIAPLTHENRNANLDRERERRST